MRRAKKWMLNADLEGFETFVGCDSLPGLS